MKDKKIWIALSAVFIMVIAVAIFFLMSQKPPEENTTQTEQSGTENQTSEVTVSPPENTDSADTYKQVEAALVTLIVDPDNDPLLNIDESANYDKIDFENRIFRPFYQPKLTLYVASGTEKPLRSPIAQIVNQRIDPSGGISSYESSAFVDSSTSPIRWFAFTQPQDLKAAKFVWQLSIAPFTNSGNLLNPPGLLSSGELASDAKEFSIDFSKPTGGSGLMSKFQISDTLLQRLSGLSSTSLGEAPMQSSYYVRILPLDAQGNVIGDAGTGSQVLYGQPKTKSNTALQLNIFNSNFDLLTIRHQGEPKLSGENQDIFMFEATRLIDTNSSDRSYRFLPEGFSSETTSLVLQVSEAKFSGPWETTPGLVYQKRINVGEEAFDNLTKYSSLSVDFKEFAPPDSELVIDQFKSYFVRIVALSPTNQIGTYAAKYSKTVTMLYGHATQENVVFLETIDIVPRIPEVIEFSYTPIKWETVGWGYRYEVIRQPYENEVFAGFGDPDKLFELLPVGTKLDFTPKEEDKAWWEEALDAISDFFTDLTGFMKDLTNWISNTYANLKSGLISTLVDILPIEGKWKDALEDALTAMVDYGLVSIGIPPTLPNFDELADMGVDYLATVAMDAAGIPGSEYATQGLDELGNEISSGLDTSTNSGSPNPFNWDFIKLDNDFMYRPAYVLITLYNPYDIETPPGVLSGYNEYILPSSDKSIGAETLRVAFAGNVHYSTFKIVSGQTIPSLAPHQTLVVPVFLEEMTNKSYWTNGPLVSGGEFKMIYNNLGPYEFNFFIQYDLPNVAVEAKAQNKTEDAIYRYSTLGNSVSFKGYAFQPYEFVK